MEAQIELQIRVMIFQDEGYFIAYSPELQISTQGATSDEVKKRFGERIEIFVERALSTNTLEKRLVNLGWDIAKQEKTPPTEVVIPHSLLNSQHCENFDYCFTC